MTGDQACRILYVTQRLRIHGWAASPAVPAHALTPPAAQGGWWTGCAPGAGGCTEVNMFASHCPAFEHCGADAIGAICAGL